MRSPYPIVVLVFMGVTGTGKSTVAQCFAEKTGARFVEGDSYHSPANIEKMRQGVPLTDEDRAEWLKQLRHIIEEALSKSEFLALTCSALKASYRDLLQAHDPRVQFVLLTAPRALLEHRLATRTGHFMSPALLDSQLDTLEPPADAFQFSIEMTPEQIVTALISLLPQE